MSKFFYLGANIHQQALDIIRDAGGAVVLYEREDALHVTETLSQLERAGRAYSVDRSAVETYRRRPCESSMDQRERVLRSVLGDFKVFLLRMRFLRVDHEGAFRGVGYFSDVVDYALALAETHRPETVFCAYTPHTVESWLVVRTLEEFGARVIRLIASPLPWVLLPVQGLVNAGGCNLSARARPLRSVAVDRYLSILRGDYSVAMPYYEKQSSRFAPGRPLAAVARWRPRDLVKYLEKRLVQREFERASLRPLGDGAYAVYFLHYQPEMNTVPEADLYADQFQAVKKLSDALPPGMRLLIKEHPSTFSKRCDRRWRPAGFYERLLSVPNTRICPADLGTFELIDRAVFVASIAGVCLTEALARGKAAVTFYTPRFALFRTGLVIDANLCSVTELRGLFSRVAAAEWAVDERDLRESFERLMSSGYDGALEDTYIPQSVPQAAANSKRANCLAVRDVLDGVL
jgi:hypothetical protein